jgi:hypothetical protein
LGKQSCDGLVDVRAATTKPAQAPAGLVIVQENALIPLIDEPQAHFRQASQDYERGDQAGAARQIRPAAALIRLEAGRHDAANKAPASIAPRNGWMSWLSR